jgi:hypothetical protein
MITAFRHPKISPVNDIFLRCVAFTVKNAANVPPITDINMNSRFPPTISEKLNVRSIFTVIAGSIPRKIAIRTGAIKIGIIKYDKSGINSRITHANKVVIRIDTHISNIEFRS